MTDFSEILRLSRDLGDVPAKVAPKVTQALERTSFDIKQDWAQGADRSGLHAYSKSIDYEIKPRDGAITAEIGPNPGKRQGRFGLVEDANGDVRSAPQHAGRDALEVNEDDFYRGLDIAAFEAMGGVWD